MKATILILSLFAFPGSLPVDPPTLHPLKGEGRLTSGYGTRFHPILKVTRLHSGVDFLAPSGTPVYAAGGGVVVAADHDEEKGNYVILDHGDGYSTHYYHLASFQVEVGANLTGGVRIGAVGNSGKSAAAHLHYEVRKEGESVNPAPFLPAD